MESLLQETKMIMKKNNIKANKSLGQNFLINEEGLTENQLQKIIELKTEYQPKFHELKQKINIEKIKIDIEMCKEKRNQKIIDEIIQLNIEYNKELKKIANEFLKEYNKIKAEN